MSSLPRQANLRQKIHVENDFEPLELTADGLGIADDGSGWTPSNRSRARTWLSTLRLNYLRNYGLIFGRPSC